MAPSPDRWYLAAASLVGAVEDGYMAAGVDLPDRRFVSPGLPAWDCAMLAVQLERTFSYDGDLATEVIQPLQAAAGFALRGGVFNLHLIRCVPTMGDDGNPPPVDEEEAAAAVIQRDAELLLDSLVAAVRDGDVGGCRSLGFESWTGQGPDGGLGGGVLKIRLGR